MNHAVPAAFVVALGVVIAGCDNPASSGVGSTAEASTSSGQSVTTTTSLEQSKTQRVTKTTQLYPYLVMAGKAASCAGGLPDISLISEHFYTPITISISMGEYKTLPPEVAKNAANEFRAGAVQLKDTKLAADAFTCIAGKFDRAAAGEWGAPAASVLGSWLAGQTTPINGWPCNVLERGACADYMVNSLTSAVAVDVFAQAVIAETMAGQGGASFSEEEILERITAAMEKHAVSILESLPALQKKIGAGHFISDLTGSAEPIHFTSGEWDYQAGSGGVLLTRYGSPYAGRGMIGGIDYKAEIVVSSGAAMRERSDTAQGVTTQQKATTDARAGL